MVQINERLWNRLPSPGNTPTHHREQQASLQPGGRRHQHHHPQGAPPASGEATTAAPGIAPPIPAQQQLPVQAQPPLVLLSLFSEDDGDVESGGGRGHNRGGPAPNRRTPGGWGWESPPPSRGQSLRPWEWPDIRRGASGRSASLKEGCRKEEQEFSTPFEQRGATRRDSDEQERPPLLEGRRGKGPGVAGGGVAGEVAAEAAGVGLKRRSMRGGLGQVKKSLWGSVFEGMCCRNDGCRRNNRASSLMYNA